MLALTGTMNWVVIAVAAFIILVFLLIIGKHFALYIQANFARADIPFAQLIGMSLRKVDVGLIVRNRISAVQGGLDISTPDMERHYLAGGRVGDVVTAMIIAHKAGMEADWNIITALDLAGRDVLDAVDLAIEAGDPELLTNWDRWAATGREPALSVNRG